MALYLPVAGAVVDPFLLVGAGLLVGFLSGLLGVGGGFLLTPLLMMMGLSPAVAAASGTNALVGTSASGLLAHLRQGNVDLRLGTVLLAGGLAGGGAGTAWVHALRKAGSLDAVIVGLYVLFLGLLGLFLFSEGLLARVRTTAAEGEGTAAPPDGSPACLSPCPFPPPASPSPPSSPFSSAPRWASWRPSWGWGAASSWSRP
ncbi:MAG: TSUP family transporter [Acidobacteriota bacterium]